jgi:predicted translin family RNA/ssDNA-binding protein
MWLTKLKIAIIERDTKSLDTLLHNLPQLEEPKEIEEAIYLLVEAKNLITSLQDETSKSMKQIAKNLQFLRSTDIPTSRNLDMMS